MAQNVTFDLANTTVPAGILKMQVTVDLTGFDALTQTGGITWSGNIVTGVGSLFLSELSVGAKLSFYVGATQYVATILTVESNLIATIDLRTDNCTIAVATPTPNVAGVVEISQIVVSGTAGNDGQITTDVNGGHYVTNVFTDQTDITAATSVVTSIGATADNGGGTLATVTITAAAVGAQTDIVVTDSVSVMTTSGAVTQQGVTPVAQVSTLTPAFVVIGDTFNAIINGTTIPFVATAHTVANVTAGLTAAINANGTVNGLVTAVDMTTYVQITSDVAGTAFTISSSVTPVGSVTAYGLGGTQTVVTTSIKCLVYPTDNLLIVMDEQVEKVDVKIGLYEYDNFTMQFADDYSFYNAGFWYHLFRKTQESTSKFLITMDESGVDSFITFGDVNASDVEFDEIAIQNIATPSSGTKVRTVKLTIISGLNKLKEYSTSAAMPTILLQKELIIRAGIPEYYININKVISAIIQIAYEQSFDVDDLQVRSNDIYFLQPSPALSVYFIDLIIPADTGSYLDSATSYYWGTNYPTLFELLQSFTSPFGFIPRYYYGQADGSYAGDGSDRHRIEFITRGTTPGTLTFYGDVINSTVNQYSPYIANNVRAVGRTDETTADYFFNTNLSPARYRSHLVTYNGITFAEKTGLAPSYINFDVDVVCDFYTFRLPADVLCEDVRYFNYITGAYELVSEGTTLSVVTAVAKYYFYKFKGQAVYTRTYSDVRSTTGGVTSQKNTQCLRLTEITDEIETRTFYAIEVKKSYTQNTAAITWLEK